MATAAAASGSTSGTGHNFSTEQVLDILGKDEVEKLKNMCDIRIAQFNQILSTSTTDPDLDPASYKAAALVDDCTKLRDAYTTFKQCLKLAAEYYAQPQLTRARPDDSIAALYNQYSRILATVKTKDLKTYEDQGLLCLNELEDIVSEANRAINEILRVFNISFNTTGSDGTEIAVLAKQEIGKVALEHETRISSLYGSWPEVTRRFFNERVRASYSTINSVHDHAVNRVNDAVRLKGTVLLAQPQTDLPFRADGGTSANDADLYGQPLGFSATGGAPHSRRRPPLGGWAQTPTQPPAAPFTPALVGAQRQAAAASTPAAEPATPFSGAQDQSTPASAGSARRNPVLDDAEPTVARFVSLLAIYGACAHTTGGIATDKTMRAAKTRAIEQISAALNSNKKVAADAFEYTRRFFTVDTDFKFDNDLSAAERAELLAVFQNIQYAAELKADLSTGRRLQVPELPANVARIAAKTFFRFVLTLDCIAKSSSDDKKRASRARLDDAITLYRLSQAYRVLGNIKEDVVDTPTFARVIETRIGEYPATRLLVERQKPAAATPAATPAATQVGSQQLSPFREALLVAAARADAADDDQNDDDNAAADQSNVTAAAVTAGQVLAFYAGGVLSVEGVLGYDGRDTTALSAIIDDHGNFDYHGTTSLGCYIFAERMAALTGRQTLVVQPYIDFTVRPIVTAIPMRLEPLCWRPSHVSKDRDRRPPTRLISEYGASVVYKTAVLRDLHSAATSLPFIGSSLFCQIEDSDGMMLVPTDLQLWETTQAAVCSVLGCMLNPEMLDAAINHATAKIAENEPLSAFELAHSSRFSPDAIRAADDVGGAQIHDFMQSIVKLVRDSAFPEAVKYATGLVALHDRTRLGHPDHIELDDANLLEYTVVPRKDRAAIKSGVTDVTVESRMKELWPDGIKGDVKKKTDEGYDRAFFQMAQNARNIYAGNGVDMRNYATFVDGVSKDVVVAQCVAIATLCSGWAPLYPLTNDRLDCRAQMLRVAGILFALYIMPEKVVNVSNMKGVSDEVMDAALDQVAYQLDDTTIGLIEAAMKLWATEGEGRDLSVVYDAFAALEARLLQLVVDPLLTVLANQRQPDKKPAAPKPSVPLTSRLAAPKSVKADSAPPKPAFPLTSRLAAPKFVRSNANNPRFTMLRRPATTPASPPETSPPPSPDNDDDDPPPSPESLLDLVAAAAAAAADARLPHAAFAFSLQQPFQVFQQHQHQQQGARVPRAAASQQQAASNIMYDDLSYLMSKVAINNGAGSAPDGNVNRLEQMLDYVNETRRSTDEHPVGDGEVRVKTVPDGGVDRQEEMTADDDEAAPRRRTDKRPVDDEEEARADSVPALVELDEQAQVRVDCRLVNNTGNDRIPHWAVCMAQKLRDESTASVLLAQWREYTDRHEGMLALPIVNNIDPDSWTSSIETIKAVVECTSHLDINCFYSAAMGTWLGAQSKNCQDTVMKSAIERVFKDAIADVNSPMLLAMSAVDLCTDLCGPHRRDTRFVYVDQSTLLRAAFSPLGVVTANERLDCLHDGPVSPMACMFMTAAMSTIIRTLGICNDEVARLMDKMSVGWNATFTRAMTNADAHVEFSCVEPQLDDWQQTTRFSRPATGALEPARRQAAEEGMPPLEAEAAPRAAVVRDVHLLGRNGKATASFSIDVEASVWNVFKAYAESQYCSDGQAGLFAPTFDTRFFHLRNKEIPEEISALTLLKDVGTDGDGTTTLSIYIGLWRKQEDDDDEDERWPVNRRDFQNNDDGSGEN